MKELIAAQLVVEESEEQFAFRHALTREAIYRQLLLRERKALHRTIADPSLREHFLQRALASLPKQKPNSARRAAAEQFGGLTEREREVAALIAEGKSNREIADQLVVSERTVESHVANILFKLGFTSRAQVAAWVVEVGLGKR